VTLAFYYWFIIFGAITAAYLFCLLTAKNRRLYIAYAISGSLLGFCADYVSFTSGYYSYPDFFPITIMGLPLSMTIAEGFAAAITIRMSALFMEYVDMYGIRGLFLLKKPDNKI